MSAVQMLDKIRLHNVISCHDYCTWMLRVLCHSATGFVVRFSATFQPSPRQQSSTSAQIGRESALGI